MSLNLITDQWIPVVLSDGSEAVIAPWQMSDRNVSRLNWPRPDLNSSCYEFLIGLVFMADPPVDEEDWDDRSLPDQDRLKVKLDQYSSAFNLIGEGPLFMQDFEPLVVKKDKVLPPFALFIDSPGENTTKRGADVINKRDRYSSLDLPIIAMALYTLQNYSPAGGAGYRVSIRGGGPLSILVNPETGCLWDIIWANVPYGEPACIERLPWMRPTAVSDKEHGFQSVFPPPGNTALFDVEAFFGMPRRIRLVTRDEDVVGYVTCVNGNNYNGWRHPLSSYSYSADNSSDKMDKGAQSTKVKTKSWKCSRAIRFADGYSYRNWIGISIDENDANAELSLSLRNWKIRNGSGSVMVSGWAMDKGSCIGFVSSMQKLLPNSIDSQPIIGMIKASLIVANLLGYALDNAINGEKKKGKDEDGKDRKRFDASFEKEIFFKNTEGKFIELSTSAPYSPEIGKLWLKAMTTEAMRRFDEWNISGLCFSNVSHMKNVTDARRMLWVSLAGHSKQGNELYTHLGLQLPEKKQSAESKKS
mgnify:CR=1 FL=1